MTETKENKALIILGRYDLTVPEHTLIKRGLKLANSLGKEQPLHRITQEEVDKLICLGKKMGFVTFHDIFEPSPNGISSDQLYDILCLLSKNNIDII